MELLSSDEDDLEEQIGARDMSARSDVRPKLIVVEAPEPLGDAEMHSLRSLREVMRNCDEMEKRPGRNASAALCDIEELRAQLEKIDTRLAAPNVLVLRDSCLKKLEILQGAALEELECGNDGMQVRADALVSTRITGKTGSKKQARGEKKPTGMSERGGKVNASPRPAANGDHGKPVSTYTTTAGKSNVQGQSAIFFSGAKDDPQSLLPVRGSWPVKSSLNILYQSVLVEGAKEGGAAVVIYDWPEKLCEACSSAFVINLGEYPPRNAHPDDHFTCKLPKSSQAVGRGLGKDPSGKDILFVWNDVVPVSACAKRSNGDIDGKFLSKVAVNETALIDFADRLVAGLDQLFNQGETLGVLYVCGTVVAASVAKLTDMGRIVCRDVIENALGVQLVDILSSDRAKRYPALLVYGPHPSSSHKQLSDEARQQKNEALKQAYTTLRIAASYVLRGVCQGGLENKLALRS